MIKQSEVEQRIRQLNTKKKCSKKCYPTPAKAKEAIKRLKKIERPEDGHYYCNDCSAYHLTSWSRKKRRYLLPQIKNK